MMKEQYEDAFNNPSIDQPDSSSYISYLSSKICSAIKLSPNPVTKDIPKWVCDDWRVTALGMLFVALVGRSALTHQKAIKSGNFGTSEFPQMVSQGEKRMEKETTSLDVIRKGSHLM
jgi:hypothetical protein